MLSALNDWSEMSNRVRVSLLAGLVAILALTLGAFFWLASEEYEVLFSDLEPRDAASVVSELERMKIEYSLDNGGTQIKVPESEVHEVRLKLMGSGVPLVGGVGFEIFDDSDFGMTDFAQRINYQRALEGELTRTVMSLKEVKYARVHLVMPDRGVFQQSDNPASASVTLFLHEGRQPGSEQILGIQRLVSASVPNLKSWQVTVTDQRGMTLSRPVSDQEGIEAVSGRLEQKQAVEKYLSEKANEVLKQNFGSQHASVSIDVVLDFSQVKRTREVVLSPSGKGEPGVVRRRETQLGLNQEEGKGNMTKEVEYRLGRDVEQIVETPGNITRLSVGVMVPPETSQSRRDQIRDLVKMAVGFTESRGDAIAVYPVGDDVQGFALAGTGPIKEIPPSAHLAEPVSRTDGVQPLRRSDPLLAAGHNGLEIWISHNPRPVLFFAAALSVALLAVLFFRIRQKPVGKLDSSLSEADRSRILNDVRRWMESGDDSRKVEAE